MNEQSEGASEQTGRIIRPAKGEKKMVCSAETPMLRNGGLIKEIRTGGISCIEPVPGAGGEWYFGLEDAYGDLYEAEELFRDGRIIRGRKICLVHYPDGQVFIPVPKTEGHYSERPVYYEDCIFMPDVDFPKETIRIIRFGCRDYHTGIHAELPLFSVKDCYNLRLVTAPLTLCRQCAGNGELEILWPERFSISMENHDSFFMRDGMRLFFNRWHEEGDGADYRYWEETIVRNPDGEVTEILSGDVMRMPNGEIWHLH